MFIAALRPGSLFDRITTFLAYLFFALPTFWVGLMAIIIFSGDLQWFPFGGLVDLSQAGSAFGTTAYWNYFQHSSLAALLDLARHPATATHVAAKLAGIIAELMKPVASIRKTRMLPRFSFAAEGTYGAFLRFMAIYGGLLRIARVKWSFPPLVRRRRAR